MLIHGLCGSLSSANATKGVATTLSGSHSISHESKDKNRLRVCTNANTKFVCFPNRLLPSQKRNLRRLKWTYRCPRGVHRKDNANIRGLRWRDVAGWFTTLGEFLVALRMTGEMKNRLWKAVRRA